MGDRSIVYQQSSYDRTGYNMDYFQFARFGGQDGNKNYIETIKSGQVNNSGGPTDGSNEHVICMIQGPAILERIWLISLFTGEFDVTLRFYFDGETSPRLTITDRGLFEGSVPGFHPPLVHNFQQSSGGSISYLQMPINESLIITVDSARIYYQFGYRQLSPDTILTSWTGSEDHSYWVAELNKAGTYPKANLDAVQKDTTQHSLGPGETVTIFQSGSAGSIEGIQLHIPQIVMDNAYLVGDSGRYHKGRSRFRMQINPNANNYSLVRRMSKMSLYNVFVADIAAVRVDNIGAGNWINTDYRDYHFWEDASYTLPAILCRGKSQITIDLTHLLGTHWNEFNYRIFCDGIMTDSLDVGNAASEAAHNYSITQPYVNPITQNYHRARYLTPAADKALNRCILDSMYIRIEFDEDIEAVYCPVGLFFGTGVNDAAEMASLPAGMQNDTYYNFFSMPYWKSAHISLENRSTLPLTDISSMIFSGNNPGSKQDKGYFITQFRTGSLNEQDTTLDYIVADIQGRGILLGHVVEGVNTGDTVGFNWLEGDERIYIDDNRSPLVHGTGTEDLYNATFYFVLDEFSLPQHGMTNSDRKTHRSMYRFYLTDPVYFQKNMLFSVEHGDYNNRAADYQSLAFFYLQPGDTGYVLTDSLDVGNTASETAHDYTILANSVSIDKASAYEGPDFRNTFPLKGRSLDAGSTFTVSIRPDNDGARLLRTLDFAVKNQRAMVYVDDEPVGLWLSPGDNPHISWRDDFFYIPGQYTCGKSSIRVRLENLHPSGNWTEMNYKVYSFISPLETTSTATATTQQLRVFPNPGSGRIYVRDATQVLQGAAVLISDVSGKVVFTNVLQQNGVLELGHLPDGMYFLTIYYPSGIPVTQKIVLQKP